MPPTFYDSSSHPLLHCCFEIEKSQLCAALRTWSHQWIMWHYGFLSQRNFTEFWNCSKLLPFSCLSQERRGDGVSGAEVDLDGSDGLCLPPLIHALKTQRKWRGCDPEVLCLNVTVVTWVKNRLWKLLECHNHTIIPFHLHHGKNLTCV